MDKYIFCFTEDISYARGEERNIVCRGGNFEVCLLVLSAALKKAIFCLVS